MCVCVCCSKTMREKNLFLFVFNINYPRLIYVYNIHYELLMLDKTTLNICFVCPILYCVILGTPPFDSVALTHSTHGRCTCVD